ncbi:unnamed protein product [Caenorhabditis auriculariae]|uniref:Uncharacterized protein n=1 Tax=Caenorhabditis auriculariae TaxID=2777116 RepID=A0A8S1HG35_9PELO|nr:unnamed protein product [Caenorhabditis auriculariae]
MMVSDGPVDGSSSTYSWPQGTTTPTYSPIYSCGMDGQPCDLAQYMFVVVVFIVMLSLAMCAFRILFLCCNHGRRIPQGGEDLFNRRQTVGAEELGRGRTNYGFTEPPPRYDQLFKQDATPRGAPAEAPPPTYEQVSTISTPTFEVRPQPASNQRPTVQSTIPATQSTGTEVFVVPFDHPVSTNEQSNFQRSPREIDVETSSDNIAEHMRACALRYGREAADAITIRSPTSNSIPIGAFGTSYPVEYNATVVPSYDAISLRRETILDEDRLTRSPAPSYSSNSARSNIETSEGQPTTSRENENETSIAFEEINLESNDNTTSPRKKSV